MLSRYEDANILSEYLLFHYGSDQEILPWAFGPVESTQFPARIANLFASHYPVHDPSCSLRALDIGCAVGRSAFELTQYADEVVGIDFSEAFINAASRLKESGHLEYSYKLQGNIRQPASAIVPETLDRKKVQFHRADAMQLSAENFGLFDVILCSNLICRLPDPARFLRSLGKLANPGCILLLSSPFTWLTEFTDEAHWLGGKTPDLTAFDAIRKTLDPDFLLLETRDIPMLIREHERKFQWTVCQGSVWKRRRVSQNS